MFPCARVIADSINAEDTRLTTFEITAHRWILAEINTHRVLSRNYRSSRAVPVAKLIAEVRANPAMPVVWRKNQKGMVGGEELQGNAKEQAILEWHEAADNAASHAECLMTLGLEKGAANRILEPFLYVHGVITATDWDNFFHLRLAADAQPEFRMLAEAMRNAMDSSTPVRLDEPDLYHMPYIKEEDYHHDDETLALISAARCARVSYVGHDGLATSTEDDLALAQRLMDSGHWSPFEHQAKTDDYAGLVSLFNVEEHRNFRGWLQHRALIGG